MVSIKTSKKSSSMYRDKNLITGQRTSHTASLWGCISIITVRDETAGQSFVFLDADSTVLRCTIHRALEETGEAILHHLVL